jgi:hypothetical protein
MSESGVRRACKSQRGLPVCLQMTSCSGHSEAIRSCQELDDWLFIVTAKSQLSNFRRERSRVELLFQTPRIHRICGWIAFGAFVHNLFSDN